MNCSHGHCFFAPTGGAAVNKVDKRNSTLKKPKNKKDTDKKKEEPPIMISLSYVKGVSETLAEPTDIMVDLRQ